MAKRETAFYSPSKKETTVKTGGIQAAFPADLTMNAPVIATTPKMLPKIRGEGPARSFQGVDSRKIPRRRVMMPGVKRTQPGEGTQKKVRVSLRPGCLIGQW